MDEQTFESEILSKAQHNFLADAYDFAVSSRAAMIASFPANVRESRPDYLFLLNLANYVRASSAVKFDDPKAVELVKELNQWHDKTAALLVKLQNFSATVRSVGVLKEYLTFL